MPSPLTIKKYIAKTKKQITKQKNKMEYSKSTADKIAAKDELSRLKPKLLYFEQQMIFERVMHERNKKANRAKQQHDAIKELPGCNQVGVGEDTTDGECPF